MGPDAIAAMEARLIAVERRCVRLEDDTRTLARGMSLSRQRTWESWTDFRARPPVVVAAAHPLAGICGGISLPDSIPFTDTTFGVSATLDWDSSLSAWTHCASGLVSTSNPAIIFALHYKLAHSTSGGATVNLFASWAGSGTSAPVASTCSDATNNNDVQYDGSTQTCPPTTYSKVFVAGATSLPLRTLYQSNTHTVTVGPVAPA